MDTPPLHDCLEIWRYTYARSSLVDALDAAQALLDGQASLMLVLKKALVGHLVISYARPFTKSQFTISKRDIPLTETSVPSTKRATHDFLLKMRDKSIGHKDATAFADSTVNRVLVRLGDDSLSLHTVSPFDIDPAKLADIMALCEELIESCDIALDPYVRTYFLGKSRPAKGEYLIMTEEAPSEWLKHIGQP